MTSADPSLEEVLSSFAVSASPRDPSTLRAWVQLYPQFERELTELAHEPAIDPDAVSESGDHQAFIEKGMEGLRSLLAKQASTEAPRPMAGLFAEARQKGYSADALSSKVGLPVTLLTMLDRRLFRFASIPAAVHHALAYALELPERTLAAFLQGPPTFAQGAAFKAQQAPRLPEQVDFLAELERDPGLSADERARWTAREA